MTGLTIAEFGDLLPAFETAYERASPRARTATGQLRPWWQWGGRPCTLSSAADMRETLENRLCPAEFAIMEKNEDGKGNWRSSSSLSR